MLEADEAFRLGVREQAAQPLVVAEDVEHTHRLRVDAELGPGENLQRLLEGAEPPGRAMKPSASEAMVALRSCMLSTRRISLTPGCASSRVASGRGMTPITSPPSASTASARAPINPTEPPPYTSPSCRSTSVRPRRRAASTYSGRVPGLDPQNTQTRFTAPA